MKLIVSVILGVALASPVLSASKVVDVKVAKHLVDCDAKYDTLIEEMRGFAPQYAAISQAKEQCRIANALLLLSK